MESNPALDYNDGMRFDLQAPYKPTGDQPQAIAELVEGVRKSYRHQVLLGATGTGKTFTVANVIQQLQLPTLVMTHNKTLAAQLYAEYKDFFPNNAVEYFVSYYDYYQPEAYIPRRDLYIEKETLINEEIDRLRLAATTALMSRQDVIIVASVSAIYGLGDPELYKASVLHVEKDSLYRRNKLLRQLVDIQYQRNEFDIKPGIFRVRGDTLEILPAYSEKEIIRINFFGDEIEAISRLHAVTGELIERVDAIDIYPAKHYVTEDKRMEKSLQDIEDELEERLKFFKDKGMDLEAYRLEQRTRYDLEMLREVGHCSGIENYSRHFDQRAPGTAPWTLLDFLPSEYLLVLDESHMMMPQIRGMYNGDRSRKEVLVEYGFRLPSALDNRPLKFPEFEQMMGITLYTSATPGPYEMEKKDQLVEQIIRPTGLLDPQIIVRPSRGQVDDLIAELRKLIEKGERALVTTLTKRMAEDLSAYLKDAGFKVQYLHSEVETFERVSILRDLRMGNYDVVVGINLLREGLDLPEVSMVAILDADKEGFLRSTTALIQIFGRAARHINGKVILYADQMTDSMKRAIDETNRRRAIQEKYNEEHGISPVGITKAVYDITERLTHSIAEGKEDKSANARQLASKMQQRELEKLISEMENQMKAAAADLEFERAAMLRDQIYELRAILVESSDLPEWKKQTLLARRSD
jgi:excinuclease ABC subunit B